MRRPAPQWIGALAAVLVLATLGCSDDRNVRSYRVAKEPGTSGAPAGMAGDVAPPPASGDLAWTTPEGWDELPASSMRLASFAMPTASGATGDGSIIVLSGEGGGLVGNVNRWRGQLDLPQASRAEILDAARTEQGKLGEFLVFRLENPSRPDQAFLAAILPAGSRTAFVKLAAPAVDLDGLEPAFLSLCRSLGGAGA